jgi:hypothetical protein
MRRMIVLGAVFISGTVLLAQTKKPGQIPQAKGSGLKLTPMNVKTGLWQSTSTITIAGDLDLQPDMVAKLTPEQRARYEAAQQVAGHATTYTTKDCLTQKDLTTDPFDQKHPDENVQCHGTVLNSTSSNVEIQESCSGDASVKYTMKIHAVDQEHAVGTGQGTATMDGQTLKSAVKFEAKWLGATCPAGVH